MEINYPRIIKYIKSLNIEEKDLILNKKKRKITFSIPSIPEDSNRIKEHLDYFGFFYNYSFSNNDSILHVTINLNYNIQVNSLLLIDLIFDPGLLQGFNTTYGTIFQINSYWNYLPVVFLKNKYGPLRICSKNKTGDNSTILIDLGISLLNGYIYLFECPALLSRFDVYSHVGAYLEYLAHDKGLIIYQEFKSKDKFKVWLKADQIS